MAINGLGGRSFEKKKQKNKITDNVFRVVFVLFYDNVL